MQPVAVAGIPAQDRGHSGQYHVEPVGGNSMQQVVKAVVFAALAASLLGSPLLATAAGDEVLQKVVIVSRHGIRSPLTTDAELSSWSSRPWPSWNEPKGNLTARGAQLVTLLGRYHRAYLVA